ncbi:MAG: Trk system potassium transporter TrkA [Rhodothermales bacterium]|nr:Trk system potassium transporter TrkA [Rhodothermales bacterium]MBO6780718.1 Trk system potassium transporter TrkA [Rhodothermales bacterium]
MRAIVVGAGEVGFDVARLLAMEEHDVVVIDKDDDALAVVREKLDVMTVTGNGTSADILKRAGAPSAELLIAVTTIDEVNIVACMLASRLGTRSTIARVRSGELSHQESVLSNEDFGIDTVIHPEEAAAAEVERLIRRAGASDVVTLAEGKLHLVGLRLDEDSPVLGYTLEQLQQEHPSPHIGVMAITRGIRTILPGPADTLRKNDVVFVAAQPKHVPHVLEVMGKKDHRIEHIMIIGGSQVAARVAQRLSAGRYRQIKLVEEDRKRAQNLSELLGGVLVIHGAPTDIDLLVMEGMPDMDAVVALTDDEESNLVSCLLAKHLGVRKTVALLSKPAYIPISQSIGLDSAVNMKLTVSREVISSLRGQHVMSVASVPGLDAEILEIEAQPRSAVTRAPLEELTLPKDMLVAGVHHGKSVEIATGSTRIAAGDRAFVFARQSALAEVESFFSRP